MLPGVAILGVRLVGGGEGERPSDRLRSRATGEDARRSGDRFRQRAGPGVSASSNKFLKFIPTAASPFAASSSSRSLFDGVPLLPTSIGVHKPTAASRCSSKVFLALLSAALRHLAALSLADLSSFVSPDVNFGLLEAGVIAPRNLVLVCQPLISCRPKLNIS